MMIKNEGDALEVSNDAPTASASSTGLPLVDEVDLRQCLVSPVRPWRASKIQGVVVGQRRQLEVICNTTGIGAVRVDSHADVEGGDQPRRRQHDDRASDSSDCGTTTTLTSLVQAAVTTLTMPPMTAPPLVSGDRVREYTILETIVQGWLYKKGTGGDFSGRRWWKPRWVTLALAETSNTITSTPILICHRAPGVPCPASVIELTQSTVIMATERANDERNKHGSCSPYEDPEREEWNRHCFQVVHTHHRDDESTPKTTRRIFTAPIQDRNQWVFAMNSALLEFERRLSKARSADDAAKDISLPWLSNERTKGTGHSAVDDNVPCGAAMDPRRWTTSRTMNNSMVGGGRARSPSPVRASASMRLPPIDPRRMRSSPMRSLPSLLDVAYQ
ncbi:hypothetical protein ACHAW5_004628 [Stephanodiscus triporus]|uniref:PH domain-containing protein n=1 Tax=Stephanodiscus triporus TaxID=2934178 RepID=A0ABD3QU22_9STRA